MTDYQNRAERCSAQRVETRKIRTEYKQEMKASRCLDHNAKKFRKTVLYQHLKQTIYDGTDQAVNIAADKEECDAVEASSSETGTLTVMAVKKLKSLLNALILHKMSTVSN
ncbi:hypothetical protein EDC94DRAFT_656011 [Helicostylum pulchrum]|nr:hypothetical protein EDC94DRAFT_656011 [Helicostylum pulchrum]